MSMRSIGSVVVVVVVALVIAAFAPKPEAHDEKHGTTTAQAPAQPAGLPVIADLRVGKGREVKEGEILTAHYVGRLPNGKVFDSSREKGKPLRFLVGSGTMIIGFDRGVAGMRVGGVRKLTIPPKLAYGEKGSYDGKVPPNSTITFEVEALKTENLEDDPLLKVPSSGEGK